MLRLLIIVFLLLVVYRIMKVRSYKNARKRFEQLEAPESRYDVFVDPVCGKEVMRKDAEMLWQGDEAHGFCSKECMRAYQHKHSSDWKM